jgi:hypothetical protein
MSIDDDSWSVRDTWVPPAISEISLPHTIADCWRRDWASQ